VGLAGERVAVLRALLNSGDLPVGDVILIAHHTPDLLRRAGQEMPVSLRGRGVRHRTVLGEECR
jgi:hypothetical protein